MSEAPAAGIFISYRREAGYDWARVLWERLGAEFGSAHVFLDVEDLRGGQVWADEIDAALRRTQVMLVLIDTGWLGRRTTKPASSVGDEGDLVRQEVRAALQRGLHVIPLLVDGADLPKPDDLPEDLRPLVQRQALELDAGRMDRDVANLIRALRIILGQAETPEPNPVEQSPGTPLSRSPSAAPARVPIVQVWQTSLTTSLTHTRRRVAQVLHPLGGEVLPALTAWRAAFWLLLAALLLWGVVWPYLWPALMPVPAAVAATEAPLPAATGPVLPVGTRFRDCRDATCPWLRVLPAGTFTMGSPEDEPGRDKDEGPQHPITVAKPFAVMETEVTVGLFKAFVAETRYPVEPGCWIWEGGKSKEDPDTTWRKPFAAADQGDDHPVVCISWNTAKAFARWMTKRTGQPYRLLSEAEWEYAARAGNPAAYSFGADPKQLCRYANVGDLSTSKGWPQWSKDWASAECDDGHVYTAPVGSFQPNAFGLYDMHGNAWEWVQDCQNDYKAEPQTAEAVESTNCANRLLRGGGWFIDPRFARSAHRGHYVPSFRISDIGFRLARMLPTGS